MKLSLEIDEAHVTGFKILLEDNEDDAYFNRLSKELLIKNPAIEFSEDAKQGKYNDLSDEEYEKLLQEVKLFCTLFQNEDEKNIPYINVFELTEKLLNVYLYCMLVGNNLIRRKERK